jgi:hypothetical protein
MPKLIEKVIPVIFALIFSLGWSWTDVLKQQNIINDAQKIQILIILSVLITTQQIYLVLPSPISLKVIEKRKVIIENNLTDFLERYYNILEERRPERKTFPTVRVNIMLPTKKWRGILGTHLKIYFYKCPDDVIYSSDEFSFKWQLGEGTCGTAWKINKPSVFDPNKPELNQLQSVNPKKIGAINSIKCTLSIPIWMEGAVVGVLNLDSKQNMRDTLFLDNDVIILAQAFAETLSGQFHEDGVEG